MPQAQQTQTPLWESSAGAVLLASIALPAPQASASLRERMKEHHRKAAVLVMARSQES